MIPSLLSLLLLAALLGAGAWWVRGRRRPAGSGKQEKHGAYAGLRAMALDHRRDDGNGPAAALMELGAGTTTASLVTVWDGSTSLYLSSGGGVIGAGEHESVRRAAATFLRLGGEMTPLLTPTDDCPLPGPGRVRFSVVGDDGVRTIEADVSAIEEGQHALSPLYAAGQNVLTEIRLVSSTG